LTFGNDFPDVRGYSPRNLKYRRAFAAAWPEGAIVQAPLAQLPWYHHVTLIDRLLGSELRLWCAAAAIAEWATTGTTALTEELTSSLPRIQDIEAELAGQ
jgi:hypothetical protein